MKALSAGVIWYKMQPHAGMARAVSDLLTDYCGEIQSHDATVQPQKLRSLLAEVLSRADVAVIIGGADVLSSEENAVFVMAGALSVPLEEGRRSRSRYCYDTLRGKRLPSPAGAVLFPTRFGGPEGMVLMAGQQTVILLPTESRAAIAAAVAMRRFLAPYAAQRWKPRPVSDLSQRTVKSYQKFAYAARQPFAVTREYSESQLSAVMERAAAGARRRYAASSVSGSRHRRAVPSSSESEEEKMYARLTAQEKVRNVLSLLLVLGSIAAVVIVFVYFHVTI